jgi:signal peptidase II
MATKKVKTSSTFVNSTSSSTATQPWVWLGLAAIVIVFDQFTKRLIMGFIKFGDALPVTSWLDIVHVVNKGAAFSFLANAGGWQRWFFTGLACVVSLFIVYLLFRHGGERLFCLALALILGGAIGNVIDRVLYGHVVDFVLLHYKTYSWPAFNVADSAISVGAVCIIVDELRRVKRAAKGGGVK